MSRPNLPIGPICISALGLGAMVAAWQTGSLSAAEPGPEPRGAVTGFYVPTTRLPETFRDFGSILVSSEQRGVWRGRLIPRAGKVFDFKAATGKDGVLRFRTATVRGVSYGFQGGFGVAASKEKPTLAGTLQRYEGDRLAATAKLRFSHDPGHGE